MFETELEGCAPTIEDDDGEAPLDSVAVGVGVGVEEEVGVLEEDDVVV